ncbi:FecR family protein [Peristeroidobacter soli]|uniref:FecR family protein n=1 Tax=Peristeroidobacter soli TaxID=2497877 RepID=UPI00158DCE04|nr:FecR domain-containing protein [Peristeroidobacter soli]
MDKRIAKLSGELLDEANAWFIDFNENQVDAAGREAFNAWLRRSPECVRAFLQVSAFWEDAGAYQKWSMLDTEGLIARARAEQNIFHLGTVAHDRPAAEPNAGPVVTKRSVKRVWLAAASVVVAAGAGFVTWYSSYVASVYTTGIGEQRSITLEDGSMVELNARSRLRVRFTENSRSVDLVEGQALFTVAKNPERPFVVTTNDTHVRAVGTRFDVYRKRAGTVVTVVEGRVAVNPNQRPTRGGGLEQLMLGAGEQTIVSPIEVAPPAAVDTFIATAWTEKKLVFESTPLREVVEEFNRYNRRQLVIRDPDLFDFHVSGVFPSTDSSRVIEFLRQRFGVVVDSAGQDIELSGREHASPAGEPKKIF